MGLYMDFHTSVLPLSQNKRTFGIQNFSQNIVQHWVTSFEQGTWQQLPQCHLQACVNHQRINKAKKRKEKTFGSLSLHPECSRVFASVRRMSREGEDVRYFTGVE